MVVWMTTASRAIDRGNRLGERALQAIGREFEAARRGLGLSQAALAGVARVSRPRYSRIENGKARTLQVVEVTRLATVLGLEAPFRMYPSAVPLRDAGHVRRLHAFLAQVAAPLTARTEVPLPSPLDRHELRAWDAMLFGHEERTAVELEMRLYDAQAVERRLALKRRDDPTEHFLLLVADTRTNRRVLAAFESLFVGLPRLKTAAVRAALEAGRHPGTGMVLV
jgi:transcriptional regulator with XRE-family HTH domain